MFSAPQPFFLDVRFKVPSCHIGMDHSISLNWQSRWRTTARLNAATFRDRKQKKVVRRLPRPKNQDFLTLQSLGSKKRLKISSLFLLLRRSWSSFGVLFGLGIDSKELMFNLEEIGRT